MSKPFASGILLQVTVYVFGQIDVYKRQDIDKLDLEYQDKYESRENDRIMKEQQLKHEKTDSLIKNILTGVVAVSYTHLSA